MRARRSIALPFIVLLAGGCTQWQPTQITPQRYIEQEQPSKVRLTDASGTRLIALDPTIAGDSVAFRISQRECRMVSLTSERTCDRVDSWHQMPLIDVRVLERARIHPASIVLPVAAAAGLGVLVWYLSVCGTKGCS